MLTLNLTPTLILTFTLTQPSLSVSQNPYPLLGVLPPRASTSFGFSLPYTSHKKDRNVSICSQITTNSVNLGGLFFSLSLFLSLSSLTLSLPLTYTHTHTHSLSLNHSLYLSVSRSLSLSLSLSLRTKQRNRKDIPYSPRE
jgi:hypothetical protein